MVLDRKYRYRQRKGLYLEELEQVPRTAHCIFPDCLQPPTYIGWLELGWGVYFCDSHLEPGYGVTLSSGGGFYLRFPWPIRTEEEKKEGAYEIEENDGKIRDEIPGKEYIPDEEASAQRKRV